MNSARIIVVGLFAGLIGLGIGYFLFRQTAGPDAQEHTHQEDQAPSGEETIYTCSMHPQIRQNEPGLCPICEMELIPLEENASDDPLVLQMSRTATELAAVRTTKVDVATGESKVMSLNGKIQADERRVSSQVAHVPGRLEELFVTFTGEQVKRGQRLARIYSPALVTAQRELLEALRFADQNPDLVEAARKKLYYWNIPEETVREIEESGKIQETITVYAEKGGVVRSRKVSVGDYVKEGEVLFDLVDLGRVWVLFDAYEEDLSHLDLGDRVVFTTPAIPGQRFETRISFIDPTIDPITRVAVVRAEVSNTNGRLKPEMFVRGSFRSSLNTGGDLVVPKTAVLWTGKRSVVYVRLPDREIPSFEYREILLGESLGEQYLVKEGLQPGEEVVTHGAFSIDAAAQLNNQQSMINRMVEGKAGTTGGSPDHREEAGPEFRKQLSALTDAYVQLKDALVATDAEAASARARGVLQALGKVDMLLLEGEPHDYWMQKRNELEDHAQRIVELNEVEAQRKQFESLSDIMIDLVKAYGISSQELYVQHCPMAFDDEGADWLSYERQIQNPYFGDKMLKCGLVTDSLFVLR